MEKRVNRAVFGLKSAAAKVGAGVTGLAASGMALAGAPTSPGQAIATELASGKTEVMLVIAAAAVIIGALILWAYVKRAR